MGTIRNHRDVNRKKNDHLDQLVNPQEQGGSQYSQRQRQTTDRSHQAHGEPGRNQQEIEELSNHSNRLRNG